MAIQKLGKVSIMAKGNYISSEVYFVHPDFLERNA